MNRRTRANLFPLDTNLEKTLRNLKKEKTAVEASSMAEHGEVNQNLLVVAERP